MTDDELHDEAHSLALSWQSVLFTTDVPPWFRDVIEELVKQLNDPELDEALVVAARHSLEEIIRVRKPMPSLN
jgi:hypothetical protein